MLRAIERKPVASLVEIGNNTLPVCGRVALQRAAASEGERVERVGWVLSKSDHLVTLLDSVQVGPSSNFARFCPSQENPPSSNFGPRSK